MLDPRIPFKNRWLAGVLAFLIPGAGHLYQGRYFKGILCAICILGTFAIGMDLGDWSVVYWKRDPTNFLNPYYAQFFVGLPAIPSLLQSRRSEERGNVEQFSLDAPLTAPFHGQVTYQDPASVASEGDITGHISVEPQKKLAEGPGLSGKFTGTLTRAKEPSKEVTLTLEGSPRLGKPLSPDPDRTFEVDVVDSAGNPPRAVGRIRGNIPRSFVDRFEVPPTDRNDEDYYLDLHRQLGKFYELAMTFTMIAGLLNILVILDAFEGPAYGYGGSEGPREANSAVPAPAAAKVENRPAEGAKQAAEKA
jgi:hypothetical protein